jgi:glycosyltransferase involved in cell wall biosynthesis
MKKVSVIMPVYNCERFIPEAITSVLVQTYKNIELIIVDDGSTDGSYKIAKSYESENVKVFTQNNSGACKARNFAFNISTGDYIQYLDADDILAPNKISVHVNLLEKHGSDCIVFCSYTHNYDSFKKNLYLDQEINKNYFTPLDLYIDIFKAKGNIAGISWLLPREIIQQTPQWNEQLIKAQDLPFFVNIALKTSKVLFSKDTLVYYRITGFNITANQNPKAIESVLLSAKSVQESVLRYENSERVREALVFLLSSIFCIYYSKKTSDQLRIIERDINTLNGKLIYSGNKYFGYLSKIIGIKSALLLKRTLKAIF